MATTWIETPKNRLVGLTLIEQRELEQGKKEFVKSPFEKRKVGIGYDYQKLKEKRK